VKDIVAEFVKWFWYKGVVVSATMGILKRLRLSFVMMLHKEYQVQTFSKGHRIQQCLLSRSQAFRHFWIIQITTN
jgi:hypothetical protein